MRRFRISRVLAAAVTAACITLGAGAPANAAVMNNLHNILDNIYAGALDIAPEGVYGLRIGLGPGLDPDFRGDSHMSVHAQPLISLRYKNMIAIDNNQVRVNFLGHWGNVMNNSPWSAGPIVRIDFGRDESDSPKLKGLGDVGTSLELGGYVGYRIDTTRLRIRVRQDVIHGHNGFLADFDANSTLLVRGKWTLSSNGAITWASSNYMNAFYGVTPAQSIGSGLPVFHAGSGLHDVTLNLVGTYEFNARWSALGSVGYSRLFSSAAHNPLVSERGSPNQTTAAVFAIYTFH